MATSYGLREKSEGADSEIAFFDVPEIMFCSAYRS